MQKLYTILLGSLLGVSWVCFIFVFRDREAKITELTKQSQELEVQLKTIQTHTVKVISKLPNGDKRVETQVSKDITLSTKTTTQSSSMSVAKPTPAKYRLGVSLTPSSRPEIDALSLDRRLGDSPVSIELRIDKNLKTTLGVGVEFGR